MNTYNWSDCVQLAILCSTKGQLRPASSLPKKKANQSRMTVSLSSLPVSNYFQDQAVAEVNIILMSSVFLKEFLFFQFDCSSP